MGEWGSDHGMRHWLLAAALAAAIGGAAPAWAQDEADEADAPADEAQQDQPDEPAEDAPALEVDEEGEALVQDGEVVPIVIQAVQGMVQVRPDAEAEWARAEAGMELGIGATFRTGPRSLVRFSVGPTQVITLDRLGTVEVLDAIEAEGMVSTDIGMPYGRTRYEVQASEDVEHSGRIRSPNATLAVSGSEGFLDDYADRPPRAGSDSGTIGFVNTEGQFIPLDPPSRIKNGETAGGETQWEDGTYISFWFATADGERWLLGRYPAGTYEQWLKDFDEFHDYDSAGESFEYFLDNFGEGEPPGDGGDGPGPFGPLTFNASWIGGTEFVEFVANNQLDEIMRIGGPTSTGSGGVLIVEESSGQVDLSATWEEPPETMYQAFLQNNDEVGLQVNAFQGVLVLDGDVVDSVDLGGFILDPGDSETITIDVPPGG